MAKKIYVGNLSFHTDEEALRQTFAPFGELSFCSVVIDRYTGKSRGFGFVEFVNDQAASEAINAMNGQTLDGRQLRVSESNEKPQGNRGGGYNNRY